MEAVISLKNFFSTILKVIIFFIGWAILASVLPIPATSNDAVWRFWAELMPFLAIVIVTLVFWLIDRRRVPIRFIGAHIGGSALIGIGVGVGWIVIAAAILFAGGWIRVSNVQSVGQLPIWLIALFLNTIMQELLVRGYLYQRLRQSFNIPVAAVVSTTLFLLCHGGALEAGWLPCANIVLMSLFVTAVLEYTGSLIAPVFIHFLWNSIGGILLGGVSLAEDYPHLVDLAMHGNVLISGGVFKIEGSVVVLVLNTLLFVIFALLAWRENKRKGI